jgi:membrane-associated phospholipid phosphatase
MKKIIGFCFGMAAFAGSLPTALRADEVTDWNKIMLQAALVAPATSPLVMGRVGAIVQVSVFEAVNGIERRYTPVHAVPFGPVPGASRRAAAVQAAYAALVRLYPSQKSTFDAKLAASLAAIASDAAENSESIARGIDWGQAASDAIWTWRSTDGFTPAPPPFLGGSAVGQWRPTPPGLLPGAGPQFAYMTPWVIGSPSQFRPAGQPALGSARYATDFKETQSMGSLSSSIRTADQTLAAQFWNASTPAYFWDTLALALGAQRHYTLSENAHLLALVNVAIADAAIACWEAKYHYVFWRPVTAIPLADTDGNPDTTADPTWTPLLTTPAFPEYPSGHSSVSGAAVTVLASYFGNGTSFSMDSDVLLGVTRTFSSFPAALSEIQDARVFGGIHFRTACVDAQATGTAVANYILANAGQPVHGIVPVAASAPGALGSSYKTAVGLHNPSPSSISGMVIFRRQGVPGSSADPAFTYTLLPYETFDYADFLAAIGQSGLGSLDLVATTGAIPVTEARIYNASDPAATGAREDLIFPEEALLPGLGGTLLAPADLSRYRYNIGVRTLSAGAVMTVTIRDKKGASRRSFSVAYPGDLFFQLSANAFLGLSLQSEDSIRFALTSGRAVIYGATADNTTQEPEIFIATRTAD